MPTYDLSLADRTALVTGAARNLPAAIAAEFAAAGAAVAINDLANQAQAEALAASINDQGGRAAVFMADVADREQAARLVKAVENELGTVDILINGAGPFAMDPFPQLPEADWDRVMDANLKAVYMLSGLVAPGMKAKGWGRIINVSAGSADLRNHSIYGLSKWGIRHLTESLALELGPEITVNAISPGQIAESAPDISEFDPTFIDRAIAWTPVGRLVTRPEIARLMVLICSPLFDIVTGETLRMDGGWGIPRW
ncbi:MAG: SDR family oxidoreductase [Anaerolineae bacterium]|jgi:NAD(P)-dependent dehydrogenase (short-subunit alcohol dehydrogenase family)